MNDEEDKQIERVDFLQNIDRGLKNFRKLTQEARDNLTPKEREVLDARFGRKET